MMEDPIVAEIHRYRMEHAKKYGHDIKRIWEALKEFETKSDYNFVRREPRLLSS
jgi:hypothetical protein